MRPHPLLSRLFASLEHRGVAWLLLRDPSDFARPGGDVDLLVSPRDAGALVELAEAVGFVPLPGWESPPGLILVTYDRASDHWLILDIATTVSFRAPAPWDVPRGAEEVLSRRRVDDGVARPSEADAFWLLLGHCLLDDGGVAARYRDSLRELAHASDESFVGRAIVSAAGGETAPADFSKAVIAGAWREVDDMGVLLASGMRRRRSFTQRSRTAARHAVRVARKPLLFPRRRGLSVALVGPNGVGKSTVAAGLQQGFPLGSTVLHMGLWKTAEAHTGSRVAEILTRPLRLWGRSAVAHYHQARGRLVIYDRYVYEARLPAKPPLLAAKRLYHWGLRHAVPRPDAAVVLDVPGELAYRRKQENPPEELESERRVYASLAATEPRIELVDASGPADAVCADVKAIVWRKLSVRWRRGTGHAGAEPAD